MHPRTLHAFVPLSGFVRPRPITLGIPPQPGKGVRESGWRLGRGEGLAEVVKGHCSTGETSGGTVAGGAIKGS